MPARKPLFLDRKRPAEKRIRLRILAELRVSLREIVENRRHVRMHGIERALVDRPSALIERKGVCVPVLVPVHRAEVAHHGREIGMIASQVALLYGKATTQCLLRLGKTLLREVDAAQVRQVGSEILGVWWSLSLRDRERALVQRFGFRQASLSQA